MSHILVKEAQDRFLGKTIERMDAEAVNVLTFHFTDGSQATLEVESDFCLVVCDDCGKESTMTGAEVISQKFKKLSKEKAKEGKSDFQRLSETLSKPRSFQPTGKLEDSDLHDLGAESRRRAQPKQYPSAAGGPERPAVSRYFPSTSTAPQVPTKFSMELAVWIAKLMPKYWSPEWTYDTLMEVARRDKVLMERAQKTKTSVDLHVKARSTVVLDRLNIMRGNAGGVDSASFELRFVKDVIRFKHFLGLQERFGK